MVVSGKFLSMHVYAIIYVLFSIIFITGVTIQMTEIQEVMEGGIVRVCASLTGRLGRNVEVGLATSSGGTGEKICFSTGCNVIML